MRVALIPSWFPTPEKPLFGSFVMEQARALCLSYADLEMHVLAPDWFARARWLSVGSPLAAARTFLQAYSTEAPVENEPDYPNLFVHRVPTVHAMSRRGFNGWTPHRHVLQREMLRIERRRGPFDLLHAHVGYPAGVICADMHPKRPWILTEHQGPFPFPDLRASTDGSWRRTQRAFQKASAVVAVSRMQAQEIECNTTVRPTIIPNLCDERAFYPRHERAPGAFRFLTVGGLVEGKGIDVLLEGIARFVARGHHALFTIVGVGPLEAQLRNQCRTLGLEAVVEWRGGMTNRELPDLFRSADAFVLPSRHESFGVVYIEALASGIPVVATRCGGPEEFVTDENGLLVPVDDPDALAGAMAQAMDLSFDSARIREGFMRSFSGAVVSAQIRKLYDDVLRREAA